MSTFPHFATGAIKDGNEPEQWTAMDVVPPISCSTTFKQTSPGDHKGFDYGRAGNPTRAVLEKCLAGLEGAKYASVFSSGLSASAAIFGLLSTGDHIICCDDVYGGTNRYLRNIANKNGITGTMTDLTVTENVRKNFQSNTKMVWIESLTNPLLKLGDIKGICDLARSIRPDVYIIVDNTFMSPYFQRPLTLGCDIVLHSITKYINGHSDVLMGCTMTNNEKLFKHFEYFQKSVGAVPSAFDAFLVNRGIKTLALRMKQHMINATQVARFLEDDPRVEKIFFPEFPSHPQHELHKRQSKGMSGMVSIYIRGGLEETKRFLSALKIFILAESLGGYESLADHPGIMTHASVPLEERIALGISDNLVRLSVGLEDAEDLIEDLRQALDAGCGPIKA